jgi:hypothetical protein
VNISNPLKRDRKGIVASRVSDEAARQGVIEVLAATYQREKGWVKNPADQIPPSDLKRDDISWFLARTRGNAARPWVPSASITPPRSSSMPATASR